MASTPPSEVVCAPQLRDWLISAAKADASDVHLVAGYPPMMRVHGRLQAMGEVKLAGELLAELLPPLCPFAIRQRFGTGKNADFSCSLDVDGRQQRFRANYFLSDQRMGACFRIIPEGIPEFEWAGFPRHIAEKLAGFRNGLVLITGVTGSGKTTTLAMIINLINNEGGYRIITVEEPVEYLFPKTTSSVVSQREVGVDVNNFAEGLRFGLRQDPDVILVGEIRDRATAQMALSAAETGHLVFSTMHTRDAKGAVSRYADFFPLNAQGDIRAQLSLGLRAVISQHLLPSAVAGEKRKLALEILFNNQPISSAIRMGKFSSIDNNILTGRSEGMCTLADAVRRLYENHDITRETAAHFVDDLDNA